MLVHSNAEDKPCGHREDCIDKGLLGLPTKTKQLNANSLSGVSIDKPRQLTKQAPQDGKGKCGDRQNSLRSATRPVDTKVIAQDRNLKPISPLNTKASQMGVLVSDDRSTKTLVKLHVGSKTVTGVAARSSHMPLER
jgi:hypothetical protein